MCSLERNKMGAEGAGYLSDTLKVNKTLVHLKYAAPLIAWVSLCKWGSQNH